jgi:WD40 repeat protein
MQPCPSREQFEQLLAQHTSDAERAALERHVEECSACQQALEELTRNLQVESWRRLHATPDDVGPAPSERFLRQVKQTFPPDIDLGTDPSTPEHQPESEGGPSQALPPGPALEPLPRRLAGFEIEGLLGRGGMGVVYRAQQVRLKRPVALKVILAGAHAPPRDRDRFLAEALAVARLQHPHIVQIHEVGEWQADAVSPLVPFFALELVDGGTLARRLQGTPLPSRQAAQLVETLARAIHYAHERGIVHRDLKPANIMLTADGQPKVSDFGLAKHIHGDSGPTSTGDVLGTPSYMAPEQAAGKGREIGPRVDIYALGAILYEMLTGRPPFKAETPLETLQQVAWEEPVPPGRLQSTIPRDLETICLKCLHKEPWRRYGTAAALADDLSRFLNDRPIQARPTHLAERLWRWCRRNPVLAVVSTLAGAALLAAAVLAVVFHHNRQEAHTQSLLAAEERRQKERLEAGEALERGLRLCEQADVGQGLLWLGRGLDLAVHARAGDLEETIQTNLAAWRSQLSPLRACLAQPSEVTAMAVSPDGRTILTGGADGTARLWDTATGKALGAPFDHSSHAAGPAQRVSSVAFSGDGRIILTASHAQPFRLWNATTHEAIGQTLPEASLSNRVVFSPDNKTLLTANGNTIRLWEVATGKPIGGPLLSGAYFISALAFSPDGKVVLMATLRPLASLWDAATGKHLALLPHSGNVQAGGFGPDGKTFLTVCDDSTVHIWETATGHLLRRVNLPTGEPADKEATPDLDKGWAIRSGLVGRTVTLGSKHGKTQTWALGPDRAFELPVVPWSQPHGVAVSPDGRTVLTGSRDNLARLWEAITRKPLGLLHHPGGVEGVAFAPDSRTFLTRSIDSTVRVWETAPGSGPDMVLPYQGEVWALAFSPDGRTIATGGTDKTARLWDAVTGRPIAEPIPHRAPVPLLAFSPDSRTIATGAGEDTIRLWDAATGQARAVLQYPKSEVLAFTFSPDGRTILTGGTDQTARLWDAATGKPLGILPHQSWVDVVAFSPDGKTVLTGSRDQTARLWDAATGTPRVAPLRHDGWVMAVAFSPDGKTVLTGSWDKTAGLWEVAAGRRLAVLGHQYVVSAVAFSPDGQALATGSYDRTARLWDAATGLPRTPPLQHEGQVVRVVFSPDGSVLATGGEGVVRLWATATGAPLGLPFTQQSHLGLLAFSPDGRSILVAGRKEGASLWPVPQPVRGDAERINLWLQVATGAELDPDGSLHILDAGTWQERRRRLEEMGGWPQR